MAPTSAYGQDLRILGLGCMPNPSSGPAAILKVKLSGPADSLRLRVYSRAFVCVSEQLFATALAPGWNALRLDLTPLGPGSYFIRAEASAQGLKSQPAAPLRLFRLP